MDLQLTNQTALVTGATRGIGRAIAFELAREGADVLVNGRSFEAAERTAEEIRAAFPSTSPRPASADLTDPRQRESLFQSFPAVDLLINNMGIYAITRYEDASDEVWETYFRTNVLAANALCRFYLPGMLQSGGGRILFIASEEAVMPSGQMPQYAAAKSALLSLSRSLSKLTAGTDVTVNTLLPGPTLSEHVRAIIESVYADEDMTFEEKERNFMAGNLPQSELRRFIRPDEIGRLAAFVCSPLASAFRGSPIRMDGGIVPTIY
ncbi:SDR family NAD(P)-dependent oxidoreductase [Saccharibacillus sp. CPCC 101409]|uniref:SDR family NAD(P)-dependent oxidoreductase n=1 Tax=Saccharibacillus sp. CPCC 101409 TaxID=3058041 RepID=UPI002671A292|nr:SDR family NAD(P)-dependent oxidoreductase [Saccharibacillus sp. CPCC 101409]MDO3411226.1 SDR family NAD(P)-dependent oxidoreductase [Saccharibacillus sp. CPCC 101409]